MSETENKNGASKNEEEKKTPPGQSEGEPLLTSAFSRMIELGALAGKVGVSLLAEKTASLFRSETSAKENLAENLIKNAWRVAETLGRLRGAAMKVGQMLSLHEGVLPKEVMEVLSLLQKDAPSIPFSDIMAQVRKNIADPSIFASIEEKAYAAASIGQVHRAKLRDGRQVVLKVQYPGIDEIIKADLKNLKGVLGSIVAMISRTNMDPIWEEMEDRLSEELDYFREASYMKKMAELYRDSPDIIIPEVIEEASGRQVLTTLYTPGISPAEAVSGKYDQALKNRWGIVLFEWVLSCIFRHGILHADPNIANFSFLEDGRVNVYDFGCMKEIPESIVSGYRKIARAGLTGEEGVHQIPEILRNMGIHRAGGKAIDLEMIRPYFELLRQPFGETDYAFGETRIYEKLMELGRTYWYEALDIQFPKHIVFIDRTIGGHFGNLNRLKASARWRDILQKHVFSD